MNPGPAPMHHVACAVVPPEHPSLPGHFPGHPIVPGVVLLALVEQAARATLGCSATLESVPAVKFLRPVAPGEPLAITIDSSDWRDSRAVRFVVAAGGAAAASGSLRFAAAEPAP